MANFVVIGITGDTQLYLADLSAGTISPLAPQPGSPLSTIDQLRNAGATVTRGVNLAVTVGSASDAASGRFDETPASTRFDEGAASGRFDN